MINFDTHILSLFKRTICSLHCKVTQKLTRFCDNAMSKTSCDLFVCRQRKGMTQWESLPPRTKVGLWKHIGRFWWPLTVCDSGRHDHVVFLISACMPVTLETSFDTESCERQLGVFLNELKQCCIYWNSRVQRVIYLCHLINISLRNMHIIIYCCESGKIHDTF